MLLESHDCHHHSHRLVWLELCSSEWAQGFFLFLFFSPPFLLQCWRHCQKQKIKCGAFPLYPSFPFPARIVHEQTLRESILPGSSEKCSLLAPSLFWYRGRRKRPDMELKWKVLVVQSRPTLCDPLDYSPPGSSVHGILQDRILEWVAIPFSRGSCWARDQTRVSCTGRWILYHQATRKTQNIDQVKRWLKEIENSCFVSGRNQDGDVRKPLAVPRVHSRGTGRQLSSSSEKDGTF